MCIALLILKIQSINDHEEMLHVNAFLATLTVFAFIEACFPFWELHVEPFLPAMLIVSV